MDFHSPTLSDKAWVKDAFEYEQTGCCEYCFGNIFMWSDIYKNKILNYNGMFISKDFSDNPMFCYPVGKGDKKAAIKALIEYAKETDTTLKFFGMIESNKEELEEMFPDKFHIAETREFFDYVYRTEDLCNLSGKKYHSKKNHISFFEKNYNWTFEPINESNIEQCLLLNEHWKRLNESKNPFEISDENRAIKVAFDNYFELDFEGGVLKIEDEIVAFSFGEKLNNNTFCVHVEKAYSNIRGAYQMINRELARQLKGRYEFINREDDTGSEGLRKAKLSYHPHCLTVKYSATYKG